MKKRAFITHKQKVISQFCLLKRNSRRFILPAIFALAFFPLFLTSCQNSVGGFDSDSQDAIANSSVRRITFKGNVNETAALPAEYAHAMPALSEGAQNSVARSARPDITLGESSEFEFYATATAREDGAIIEGTFESPASKCFEMTLSVGKTWDIECGVRSKSNHEDIVLQDTFSKNVTADDSVLSHSFELLPSQEGSGTVGLEVNFESPVTSVSARWGRDYAGVPNLSSSGGNSSPANIEANAVPCGNYNIVLSFKDTNGISLYESVQSVTVLKGMTTNTWTLESGVDAISTDDDGNAVFKVTSDLVRANANSCIYVGIPAGLVGQQGVTASDSNSGSAYEPLEHIEKAFNKIISSGNQNKDFKVFISGEVEGNVNISNAISSGASGNAKSITIEGLDGLDESGNPNATLKGSGNGSVLVVDSNVPVTIKNLKITGGTGTVNDSFRYGGGIYLKTGTLKLADGVLVTGNQANDGGGVYVAEGASLYMYGTSLVGDRVDALATGTSVTGSSWTNCSNYASNGGGIYNKGSVYLGYSGMLSGSPVAASFTGGVKRNLSSMGAGGIDNYTGGILKIRAGCVSYNLAKGENADSCPGGGIRVYRSNVEISGGEISFNQAGKGGGIDAASKSIVSIMGGTIKENVAESKGGAIFVSVSEQDSDSAKVSIKGSAYIPFGAGGVEEAKKNDVFLDQLTFAVPTKYAKLVIDGNLALPSGVSTAATITLSQWERKIPLLSGTETLLLANKEYFKLSKNDSNWDKDLDAAKTSVLINCPVFVASAEENDTTRKVCSPAPTSGNTGTKAKPFASISDALAAAKAYSLPITVDGTVKGQQVVSGDLGTDGIEIIGYIPSGATTSEAILDGNKEGSTLTIEANLATAPVKIKNLKIKNGLNSGDSGYGGGINIKKGSVTLFAGTEVSYNQAKYGGGVNVGDEGSLTLSGSVTIRYNTASLDGGGIYFVKPNKTLTLGEGASISSNKAKNGGGIYAEGTNTSSCYVIMTSDATITGNMGYSSNSEEETKGGGVYLKYAILCMSGNALVGETGYDTAAKNNSRSNRATKGGGVFLDEGGKLRLGYASSTDTEGTTLDGGYGIRHNYATDGGGGVYAVDNANTAIEFKSGSIFANGAEANGGGIYLETSSTLTMGGGAIAKNKAVNGGGVYSKGTICMYGSATIGDLSNYDTSYAIGPSLQRKCSNLATSNGGGVYNDESGKLYIGYTAAGTFDPGTFTGGIGYNNAGKGGGIYHNGYDCYLAGGKISSNYAEDSGGAIYYKKVLYFGGNIYVPASGNAKENDLQQDATTPTPTIRVIATKPCTEPLVATITPGAYIDTNLIIYPPADGATYSSQFAIRPSSSGNWGIGDYGSLRSIIGTKTKPSQVGDIVFTDKSAMKYWSSMSLTDAQTAAAIGVIFYAGTALNDSGDTGINYYIIGRKEGGWNAYLTSANMVGAYSTYETNIAGTVFATGWSLPTRAMCGMLNGDTLTTVNAALLKCGGVETEEFWLFAPDGTLGNRDIWKNGIIQRQTASNSHPRAFIKYPID